MNSWEITCDFWDKNNHLSTTMQLDHGQQAITYQDTYLYVRIYHGGEPQVSVNVPFCNRVTFEEVTSKIKKRLEYLDDIQRQLNFHTID